MFLWRKESRYQSLPGIFPFQHRKDCMNVQEIQCFIPIEDQKMAEYFKRLFHMPVRCQVIIFTYNGFFIRNKFHWNINQNTYIFIQGNAFENVLCKIASICVVPSELIILSQQRITSRFSSTPSCVGIHNVAWGSDAFILRGWVIEVVR